ncbi:MAG: hypothetical protein ABI666_02005 [Ferruginibacter sp.]
MKSFALSLFIGVFLFSCKKQDAENKNTTALDHYTGLSNATMEELRNARTATQYYQSVDTAIARGYHDIGVDVEEMGHHYMKAGLVDSVFDLTQPELLVYNRDANGNAYLVAVEYAVPLDRPRPEGFTGSNDVWDGNANFNLWLLHAWVWAYNPNGVFNPTNPAIHLH